jgi:hypothetical protein
MAQRAWRMAHGSWLLVLRIYELRANGYELFGASRWLMVRSASRWLMVHGSWLLVLKFYELFGASRQFLVHGCWSCFLFVDYEFFMVLMRVLIRLPSLDASPFSLLNSLCLIHFRLLNKIKRATV